MVNRIILTINDSFTKQHQVNLLMIDYFTFSKEAYFKNRYLPNKSTYLCRINSFIPIPKSNNARKFEKHRKSEVPHILKTIPKITHLRLYRKAKNT